MRKATHILFALIFALFGGPTMVTADGVMICGADGAPRIVAFDFETGEPVEHAPIVISCGDCFACAPALTPPPAALAAPAALAETTPRFSAEVRAAAAPPRLGARAPPVLIA